MTRDNVQGEVWLYDYLCLREHREGRELGRKTRPAAFVAAVRDA